MGHEPVQRRAVVAEISLLQLARRVGIEAEMLLDEMADAPVDLGEQVAARRVERVVKIEDPVGDLAARQKRWARPFSSIGCGR